MRAVIGRIPDGTYEFEDMIDDDGIIGCSRSAFTPG